MGANNVVGLSEIVDVDAESLGRGGDGDSFVRSVGDGLWNGEGPGLPAKDYVDEWELHDDKYVFTPGEIACATRLFGVAVVDALGEHLIVDDPDAETVGEILSAAKSVNTEALLSPEEHAAKVDRIAAAARDFIKNMIVRGGKADSNK